MKNYSFILILIFLNLLACNKKFSPQNGDLLFHDLDCGPVCDAIETVTQGIHGAHLSHIGMIVHKNDQCMVLEAISAGVMLTPLNDFLSRSHDSLGQPKVIVGRLKKEYRYLIPKAISESDKYIGKPYDDLFDMENDSYYCSEMLYLIFKNASNNNEVFSLAPMTFKKPGTSEFFPQWISYFKERNTAIPEGKPGINPGNMSRSKAIEIIHIYGIPTGWKK
jgi:hypothetical protein